MDEYLRDPATIPNAPSLPTYLLHQALSLVFFTLALLPVLLYRTLTHFIPHTRPHPSWTLRRSLAISLGRLYLACTTYLSLPRDPGPSVWKPDDLVHRLVGEGTRVKVVRVPGVSDEWVVSIAKAGGGAVVPVEVPCFWTVPEGGVWKDGDEQAGEGERVIMYVNGGSWVMGHPQSTMFPYKFAKITGGRVLAVNHRKALSPSTAFPAQLLDLLAGYAYLLSQGFAAENIILVGDSSGGHLLLALSRYLAELDRMQPSLDVGMPGAMLLVSPSCDFSHPPVKRHSTDYLVPYLNQRAYPSLTRHFIPSAVHTSPYFSPAACGSFAYLACAQRQRKRSSHHATVENADLENKPACGLPVWIQYGAGENLHGDIERLVERMRADGVEVEVERVEGGVHVDAGIAYVLGERGEGNSWVRLCEAVRRYVGSG